MFKDLTISQHDKRLLTSMSLLKQSTVHNDISEYISMIGGRDGDESITVKKVCSALINSQENCANGDFQQLRDSISNAATTANVSYMGGDDSDGSDDEGLVDDFVNVAEIGTDALGEGIKATTNGISKGISSVTDALLGGCSCDKDMNVARFVGGTHEKLYRELLSSHRKIEGDLLIIDSLNKATEQVIAHYEPLARKNPALKSLLESIKKITKEYANAINSSSGRIEKIRSELRAQVESITGKKVVEQDLNNDKASARYIAELLKTLNTQSFYSKQLNTIIDGLEISRDDMLKKISSIGETRSLEELKESIQMLHHSETKGDKIDAVNELLKFAKSNPSSLQKMFRAEQTSSKPSKMIGGVDRFGTKKFLHLEQELRGDNSLAGSKKQEIHNRKISEFKEKYENANKNVAKEVIRMSEKFDYQESDGDLNQLIKKLLSVTNLLPDEPEKMFVGESSTTGVITYSSNQSQRDAVIQGIQSIITTAEQVKSYPLIGGFIDSIKKLLALLSQYKVDADRHSDSKKMDGSQVLSFVGGDVFEDAADIIKKQVNSVNALKNIAKSGAQIDKFSENQYELIKQVEGEQMDLDFEYIRNMGVESAKHKKVVLAATVVAVVAGYDADSTRTALGHHIELVNEVCESNIRGYTALTRAREGLVEFIRETNKHMPNLTVDTSKLYQTFDRIGMDGGWLIPNGKNMQAFMNHFVTIHGAADPNVQVMQGTDVTGIVNNAHSTVFAPAADTSAAARKPTPVATTTWARRFPVMEPTQYTLEKYNSAKASLRKALSTSNAEIRALDNFMSIFEDIYKYVCKKDTARLTMALGHVYENIITYLVETCIVIDQMAFTGRRYNSEARSWNQFVLNNAFIGDRVANSINQYDKLANENALFADGYRHGAGDGTRNLQLAAQDVANDNNTGYNSYRRLYDVELTEANYEADDTATVVNPTHRLGIDRNITSKYNHLMMGMIKSMYVKISTVISIHNEFSTTGTNAGEHGIIRTIFGGDLEDSLFAATGYDETPVINPEYSEAYVRMYLYSNMYRNLFFTNTNDNNGNGAPGAKKYQFGAARRFALIPIGGGRFGPLMKTVFVKNFNTALTPGETLPKELKDFVRDINGLMDNTNGSSIKEKTHNLIVEFVNMINSKYGIVKTDDIISYVSDMKESSYRVGNIEDLLIKDYSSVGAAATIAAAITATIAAIIWAGDNGGGTNVDKANRRAAATADDVAIIAAVTGADAAGNGDITNARTAVTADVLAAINTAIIAVNVADAVGAANGAAAAAAGRGNAGTNELATAATIRAHIDANANAVGGPLHNAIRVAAAPNAYTLTRNDAYKKDNAPRLLDGQGEDSFGGVVPTDEYISRPDAKLSSRYSEFGDAIAGLNFNNTFSKQSADALMHNARTIMLNFMNINKNIGASIDAVKAVRDGRTVDDMTSGLRGKITRMSKSLASVGSRDARFFRLQQLLNDISSTGSVVAKYDDVDMVKKEFIHAPLSLVFKIESRIATHLNIFGNPMVDNAGTNLTVPMTGFLNVGLKFFNLVSVNVTDLVKLADGEDNYSLDFSKLMSECGAILSYVKRIVDRLAPNMINGADRVRLVEVYNSAANFHISIKNALSKVKYDRLRLLPVNDMSVYPNIASIDYAAGADTTAINATGTARDTLLLQRGYVKKVVIDTLNERINQSTNIDGTAINLINNALTTTAERVIDADHKVTLKYKSTLANIVLPLVNAVIPDGGALVWDNGTLVAFAGEITRLTGQAYADYHNSVDPFIARVTRDNIVVDDAVVDGSILRRMTLKANSDSALNFNAGRVVVDAANALLAEINGSAAAINALYVDELGIYDIANGNAVVYHNALLAEHTARAGAAAAAVVRAARAVAIEAMANPLIPIPDYTYGIRIGGANPITPNMIAAAKNNIAIIQARRMALDGQYRSYPTVQQMETFINGLQSNIPQLSLNGTYGERLDRVNVARNSAVSSGGWIHHFADEDMSIKQYKVNNLVFDESVVNGADFRKVVLPDLVFSKIYTNMTPKNVYVAFEFLCVYMYKLFYVNRGEGYSPLFNNIGEYMSSTAGGASTLTRISDQSGPQVFENDKAFSKKLARMFLAKGPGMTNSLGEMPKSWIDSFVRATPMLITLFKKCYYIAAIQLSYINGGKVADATALQATYTASGAAINGGGNVDVLAVGEVNNNSGLAGVGDFYGGADDKQPSDLGSQIFPKLNQIHNAGLSARGFSNSYEPKTKVSPQATYDELKESDSGDDRLRVNNTDDDFVKLRIAVEEIIKSMDPDSFNVKADKIPLVQTYKENNFVFDRFFYHRLLSKVGRVNADIMKRIFNYREVKLRNVSPSPIPQNAAEQLKKLHASFIRGGALKEINCVYVPLTEKNAGLVAAAASTGRLSKDLIASCSSNGCGRVVYNIIRGIRSLCNIPGCDADTAKVLPFAIIAAMEPKHAKHLRTIVISNMTTQQREAVKSLVSSEYDVKTIEDAFVNVTKITGADTEIMYKLLALKESQIRSNIIINSKPHGIVLNTPYNPEYLKAGNVIVKHEGDGVYVTVPEREIRDPETMKHIRKAAVKLGVDVDGNRTSSKKSSTDRICDELATACKRDSDPIDSRTGTFKTELLSGCKHLATYLWVPRGGMIAKNSQCSYGDVSLNKLMKTVSNHTYSNGGKNGTKYSYCVDDQDVSVTLTEYERFSLDFVSSLYAPMLTGYKKFNISPNSPIAPLMGLDAQFDKNGISEYSRHIFYEGFSSIPKLQSLVKYVRTAADFSIVITSVCNNIIPDIDDRRSKDLKNEICKRRLCLLCGSMSGKSFTNQRNVCIGDNATYFGGADDGFMQLARAKILHGIKGSDIKNKEFDEFAKDEGDAVFYPASINVATDGRITDALNENGGGRDVRNIIFAGSQITNFKHAQKPHLSGDSASVAKISNNVWAARANSLKEASTVVIKTLKSIYAEVGNSSHMDSYGNLSPSPHLSIGIFDGIVDAPVALAIDMIPGVIAGTTNEDAAVNDATKPYLYKDFDADKSSSNGIHCSTVGDFDKLMNGSNGEMYNLIRPFLHGDDVQQLTLENIKSYKNLMTTNAFTSIVGSDNTMHDFAKSMSRLTKYLCELSVTDSMTNQLGALQNGSNTANFGGRVMSPTIVINAFAQKEGLMSNLRQSYSKPLSVNGTAAAAAVNDETTELFRYIAQSVSNVLPVFSKYGNTKFTALEYLRLVNAFNETYAPSTGYDLREMMSGNKSKKMVSYLKNNIANEAGAAAANIGGAALNNINAAHAQNILETGVWPINMHKMLTGFPMAEYVMDTSLFDVFNQVTNGISIGIVQKTGINGVLVATLSADIINFGYLIHKVDANHLEALGDDFRGFANSLELLAYANTVLGNNVGGRVVGTIAKTPAMFFQYYSYLLVQLLRNRVKDGIEKDRGNSRERKQTFLSMT